MEALENGHVNGYVEIEYPIIYSADPRIRKLVNKAISSDIQVSDLKYPAPEIDWELNCFREKPDNEYVDYSINYTGNIYYV